MPHAPHGQAETPRQLFFQTPEQRAALARQLFFDEGTRPSGLVGEAVIQSWLRCMSAQQQHAKAVSFEQVTRSRAHASLNRNRQLLQAGNLELNHMEAALAGTDCRVLLTDAQGVVIHATALPQMSQQPLLRTASRVGVNIAEDHIGTNAPGIVVRTGEACTVTGAEHFFQCLQTIYCAAAPIRDIHGQLAGVLDVSIEAGRFQFDAASVVGMYATTIENRLLQLQSAEHLVLHFQASPTLLDTPMEALAGIDSSGHVVWLNGAARRLTGCRMEGQIPVEAVFGASLELLLAVPRQAQAHTLHLPNGLGVWMKGTLTARDGADFKHAVAVAVSAPPSSNAGTSDADSANGHTATAETSAAAAAASDRTQATLLDHKQRLIETTLAACGGNIAKAARVLGVSRGMLYRRLQQPSPPIAGDA
ncbi:helix-turn-helix domain-containing protein [Hydrogenophaga sp.]|uniref:helix-turn-helix domain-containing protein n=1 Tax=Hydrogenophaga sp. TaxID=1904254 RepID=UPI0027187F64|nr:helix-turn-helix domain-containing protein [Hydrogenophaga sp.]MDO9436828.1 helix-turn-helix domain-containing protein [Hydrogenophaga sp.]